MPLPSVRRVSVFPAVITRWLSRRRRAAEARHARAAGQALALPPELLLGVADYLPHKDVIVLMGCCSVLYHILAPRVFSTLTLTNQSSECFSRMMRALEYITRHPHYASYLRRVHIGWEADAPLSSLIYQRIVLIPALRRALVRIPFLHVLSMTQNLYNFLGGALRHLQGRVYLLEARPFFPVWYVVRRCAADEVGSPSLCDKEARLYKSIAAVQSTELAHGCVQHNQKHDEVECLERLLTTRADTIISLSLKGNLSRWSSLPSTTFINLDTIKLWTYNGKHMLMMATAVTKWNVPRLKNLTFSIGALEDNMHFWSHVLETVTTRLPGVTRMIDPYHYMWEKVVNSGTFVRSERIQPGLF